MGGKKEAIENKVDNILPKMPLKNVPKELCTYVMW